MPVSKKVISSSEISAVNFIVGWWLFHCSMNWSMCSLFMFQEQNTSSMKCLKAIGLYLVLLRICFNPCHEDVGKSDHHVCVHVHSVCLRVVTFHELE